MKNLINYFTPRNEEEKEFLKAFLGGLTTFGLLVAIFYLLMIIKSI